MNREMVIIEKIVIHKDAIRKETFSSMMNLLIKQSKYRLDRSHPDKTIFIKTKPSSVGIDVLFYINEDK